MIDAAVRADRVRARTALGLTLLAVLLAVGAYILVALGQDDELPSGLPLTALYFLAAYLGGHLLIRRLAPTADPVFFPTVGLLAGTGFAMIHRLNPGLSAEQSLWLLVGLTVFAVTLALIRDHRQLDAFTYTIGLAGLGLLLLPILPGIGREVNGARLWVQFGPLSFQPAELGKVLLVVFLASYLNAKKELLRLGGARIGPFRLPPVRHLGPVLLAWGLSLVVLFVEKDLGASLLYFGIFVVMLWLATGRAGYVVVGVILFVAGAYLGFQSFEHVRSRVDVWLNALDPKLIHDEGFQLAQSQFALATGGIGGSGLGEGQPQQIPAAATDFIFSALGEELGLLGSVGILLLFVVLVGRGFRTALVRQDGFGKLLAAGMATILGLQTFIIVGGVTRLIPLTGITLPFVSYGGSSLVANFIVLALLVRVSAGPAPRPVGAAAPAPRLGGAERARRAGGSGERSPAGPTQPGGRGLRG